MIERVRYTQPEALCGNYSESDAAIMLERTRPVSCNELCPVCATGPLFSPPKGGSKIGEVTLSLRTVRSLSHATRATVQDKSPCGIKIMCHPRLIMPSCHHQVVGSSMETVNCCHPPICFIPTAWAAASSLAHGCDGPCPGRVRVLPKP